MWSSGILQDTGSLDSKFDGSSSPASANMFVTFGKILSLNCFFDLSVSR